MPGCRTRLARAYSRGVAAPVVGSLVAVLALHPAPAVSAVQPPAQDVGAGDPLVRFAAAAPGTPGVGHDGLRGLEVPGGDERLVGDGVGPDPAAGLVPAHPGLIAGGDVVDVQQDLVLALLVPDLPPGVARVTQDDADGGLGPAFPGAVPVAGPVMRGRGGDLVAGESLGDGVRPRPARYSARIRRTTQAVPGSGSGLCRRLPLAALAGFGCGPASMSR